MRFTGCLLFLVMLTNCNAQNSVSFKEIRYEAVTRGKKIEFKVTDKLLVYKENHESKEVPISAQVLKEIASLISAIDLLQIEAFAPPSEARFSDKALHATVTLVINGTSHTSQTFDHGNPPKELVPLLKNIFELLEIP